MRHVLRFALALLVAAFAAGTIVAARAQEASEGAGEETSFRRLPEVEEAYGRGVALLKEGKFKEALLEFNQATQADETWGEAFLGKAEAMKALEDYQGATLAYSRAIQYLPRSAAALNGRGECALELNQIDAAAADFAQALELDPTNPVVLSNLGHIMANYTRDPQSAIRRLDDALAQNDKDARAFRDRGYAHALLRNFKAAEADLAKAAEIDPNDYENYAMMANIYLFQDNFQGGIESLTKAIDAYKPKLPTDPQKYLTGLLSRADAWLRVGEKEADPARAAQAFEAAVQDADAVINDNPDRVPEAGRAQFRKGRALRMLQRYSEAVDAFTLALESVPSDQQVEYIADAYMFRGICWYYIGSHDLARGDFEQASSVGGGFQDPRIFLWIGFTHHQQGEYREAIEAYSEAVAKAPSFALAHTNRGRAYMDLGEYDKAIASFNDAIRAEPSVGEHYYNVGFAYAEKNDWLKAEHFLNIALRKENPQPKMYSLMATVLRERGRADLAEEYQRKAAAAAQPAQAAGG
jgi:tetratricopeptide (TPR) repeat protein